MGSLLEAIKSMLHTPSALLSCALKVVEVLGSFRFVAPSSVHECASNLYVHYTLQNRIFNRLVR